MLCEWKFDSPVWVFAGPAGRGWLGDAAVCVLSHSGLHRVLCGAAAGLCPPRPDSLRVQQGKNGLGNLLTLSSFSVIDSTLCYTFFFLDPFHYLFICYCLQEFFIIYLRGLFWTLPTCMSFWVFINLLLCWIDLWFVVNASVQQIKPYFVILLVHKASHSSHEWYSYM